ncbi:glycosyltransferase family 2 protein [Acidisoma sp. C75]
MSRLIARSVVAIPVKDEAAFIRPLLGAMAAQTEPPTEVILLVNNTRDGSAAVARSFPGPLPFALQVMEVQLPPALAHAGTARKRVLDLAAERAGPQGAVLTTDADARPPADWVARNLAHLRAGYDAVCGRAQIDPQDEAAIPPHLVADDANEARLADRLLEIEDLVDPPSADPWPRHNHESGASIALTAAIYRAVGGLPSLRLGEDRALIRRLEERDCKIRHDPGLLVVVSGRQIGRAEGGMAATIARRIRAQDLWADDRLETPARALRRLRLRHAARKIWVRGAESPALAEALGIAPPALRATLRTSWFGAAWRQIEAESPLLQRQPVAMLALRQEAARAEAILRDLRVPRRPSLPMTAHPSLRLA